MKVAKTMPRGWHIGRKLSERYFYAALWPFKIESGAAVKPRIGVNYWYGIFLV